MPAASMQLNGYMFDTSAFNKFCKLGYNTDTLPMGCRIYATAMQLEELKATPNETLKARLLESFVLLTHKVLPAESFCFDVKGAGFDEANWADGQNIAETIRTEINNREAAKKKDNLIDALIGETAVKNSLILVVQDECFYNAMIALGYDAMTFDEFLSIQIYN